MTNKEKVVAKKVVPLGAVPPAGTHEAMVSIDVHGVVTVWAVEGFSEDWNAEPPFDHGGEVLGVDVETQCFGRCGVQPLARTSGCGVVKVCLVVEVSVPRGPKLL